MARSFTCYRDNGIFEIRRSHENPYVIDIYKKYLGEPLSDKAKELLHNHKK